MGKGLDNVAETNDGAGGLPAPVNFVQPRLLNQNLAYTSTLDLSCVKWISENIQDADVGPYVDKTSVYNNNFISEILNGVEDDSEYPADYVPMDEGITKVSTGRLEVNIV